MGIKRYILLALVYMVGVGLYVYSFNGESYTLGLFGLSLELPIAIWVIVPVLVLFLATIVHLVFYSLKDYINHRSLNKDIESFKVMVKNMILEENIESFYKTEGFKLVGKIFKNMRFTPSASESFEGDEELSKAFELASSINNGKYEDLKKMKLGKNNPLIAQNNINKLKEEPKFAFEILKNCQDKNSEQCIKAYATLLDFASFSEIKKYEFTPDKASFRKMMERYLDPTDNFDMDIKSIEEMLEKFNADRADYLELAREIKVKLSPDTLIALFEKLYNTKGALAADAYLYVLYDLQMIDKIKEILDNADADEFVKFRTIVFLRDNGKSIDLDKFLTL